MEDDLNTLRADLCSINFFNAESQRRRGLLIKRFKTISLSFVDFKKSNMSFRPQGEIFSFHIVLQERFLASLLRNAFAVTHHLSHSPFVSFSASLR